MLGRLCGTGWCHRSSSRSSPCPQPATARTARGPSGPADRRSIEQVLEVNLLREVTKAVVEAARESLIIGQASKALRCAVSEEFAECTPRRDELFLFR